MAEHLVGILAESENDCRVVSTLIRRILINKQISPSHYPTVHRATQGCAKLRAKCELWLRELAQRGCRSIIVVHDRDRFDETRLRAELIKAKVPQGVKRLICIPVEEIEAWFFSCDNSMQLICGDDAQSHAWPHTVRSPKEQLIMLSQNQFNRPRYSPNDGPQIAEILNIDICAARCSAFKYLREFVESMSRN